MKIFKRGELHAYQHRLHKNIGYKKRSRGDGLIKSRRKTIGNMQKSCHGNPKSFGKNISGENSLSPLKDIVFLDRVQNI